MDPDFDVQTDIAMDNAARVCVLRLIASLECDLEWVREFASPVINRSLDEPQKEAERLSDEVVDEIDNRIYDMLLDMKLSVPHLDEPYRTDLKNHMERKFAEDVRAYNASKNSVI